MRSVIEELTVEADAADVPGQIATLHRFVSTTSRTSLQKLKWSVESVRRSLLDQMMGVLHRQARLVQVDLGAVEYERSPELAVDATESQMRGYVLLVSTKLPLVSTVGHVSKLAVQQLN